MTFLDVLSESLIPSARQALPETPWTPQACVLLGSIGLQESNGEDVAQRGGGPGLGYWQEEEGLLDVLRNAQSAALARRCVASSGILATSNENHSQWPAGAGGSPSIDPPALVAGMRSKFLNFPILQLCFARLMLWDNPKPLPALGDCNGSWIYYDETWRPGSPRPDSWPAHYAAALQHFTGG